MGVPLLGTRWYCPNCPAEAVTYDSSFPDHPPSHPCPRLAGLLAPLVPNGVNAKVEAVEREDYIGRELVQVDANGRPVMAVVTTRDNGRDVRVLAPCATISEG